MSTVVVRKVTATPIRTSSEAWDVMVSLLAPDAKSSARGVLNKAAGVACSSIASESLKEHAIVVFGSGPRVRLYCLYDADATSGEDAKENALPEVPTTGDWRMSIPCPDEDFEWCERAIKNCAPYVTVRRAGEDVPDRDAEEASAGAKLNMEEFFRS